MMHDFRSSLIPGSFSLGGLLISVRLDSTLAKTTRFPSQSLYSTQEIRIDPSNFSGQIMELLYVHELVHWIFFMMGDDDLRDNNRIITPFAGFLHQALTTMESMETASSDSLEDGIADGLTSMASAACQGGLVADGFPPGNSDWEYGIRVRWWGEPWGPDDFEEGDYSEIVYDDLDQGFDPDWDWDETEEIDYDPGCNDNYDFCNSDAWELMRMEQEEEEDRRRELESEMSCWSEYADSWARSDDEGWFYRDDD